MTDDREFEAVTAISGYLNRRRRSVAEVLRQRDERELRRWVFDRPWSSKRYTDGRLYGLHGGKLSTHIVQTWHAEAWCRKALQAAAEHAIIMDEIME